MEKAFDSFVAASRTPQKRTFSAVYQATLEVLAEKGYSKLTIEEIAVRAKVGKTTIYRWWSTKADLILFVLGLAAESQAFVPEEGPLDQQLRAIFESYVRLFDQPHFLDAIRGVSVEPEYQAKLANLVIDKYFSKRKEIFAQTLQSHGLDGDRIGFISAEEAFQIIMGALWFGLLFTPRARSSDETVEHLLQLTRTLLRRPMD